MTEYDKYMLMRKRKQLAYILPYFFPVFIWLIWIDLGLAMVWIGIIGQVFNLSFYRINKQIKLIENAQP